MSIKSNLSAIKSTLPVGVTLVAVSKFHTADEVMEAVDAGQTVFGENRVQEAYTKWPEIRKKHPDIKLHLIGALQTNKAGEAVALFDVIECVDRQKLADCLKKAMLKQSRDVPCLIQVNIGKEPQKAGVMPDELEQLLNYCRSIGLNISGLMCIPPEGQNPEPYFQLMSAMAKKNQLNILSMGMSGDFGIAIKYGATHIRVGTAIFGTRAK